MWRSKPTPIIWLYENQKKVICHYLKKIFESYIKALRSVLIDILEIGCTTARNLSKLIRTKVYTLPCAVATIINWGKIKNLNIRKNGFFSRKRNLAEDLKAIYYWCPPFLKIISLSTFIKFFLRKRWISNSQKSFFAIFFSLIKTFNFFMVILMCHFSTINWILNFYLLWKRLWRVLNVARIFNL